MTVQIAEPTTKTGLLEIRWHARGGQGAITVAKVLAAVALDQGFYVQAFPEYGPERGGAPLHAYNRLSREPIQLHCGVYEPEVVVVLDPTLLDAEPVAEGLHTDGLLLINTPESPEEIAARTGFQGRLVTIASDELARRAGIRFANVPMLGALLRFLGLPLEAAEAKIRKALGEKLSDTVIEANIKALRLGYEAAAQSKGSGSEVAS
jgi:pyruvate ferredoxin oxidoreductase gamma subunit